MQQRTVGLLAPIAIHLYHRQKTTVVDQESMKRPSAISFETSLDPVLVAEAADEANL